MILTSSYLTWPNLTISPWAHSHIAVRLPSSKSNTCHCMFKVRFGRLSLDCLRPSSWSAANSCMSLECRKIYKCTDFEQFYWNLSNIVISFMFLECRNIHEFTDFHQVFWKFSKAVNSCISCSKIHECTNFQHIFWNSQNQWIPVSFKWSKNAKIPPKI